MTVKKDSGEFNDWGMWANHVLAELKRLNESIEDIRKDLTTVTMEVVALKVKSSLYGALAGAITVVSILGADYLRDNLSKGSSPQPVQYQAYPFGYVPPAPTPSSNPTVPVAPVVPAPSVPAVKTP